MNLERQKIKKAMNEIINSNATPKEKIKAAEILLEIEKHEENDLWALPASKQE